MPESGGRLAILEKTDTCIRLSSQLTAQFKFPVDVHELNSATYAFAYYATQGQILFCRHLEEVYQFKEQSWLVYLDFYPLLKENLMDLLQV